MTPDEFEIYAQQLLDQFTPDELFDFMKEQGMFDRLESNEPINEDDDPFFPIFDLPQ